jgi:proline-specific peptidase
VSLIVASSPASIPQWVEETVKLRALLPAEVQSTLQRHEDAGTTDDPEYEAATTEFYRRHLCQVYPWPDCVQRTFDAIGLVYQTMTGPSEFHVTGTLRDRLGEIDVATLAVSGERDEATPEINRTAPSARASWPPSRSSFRTPRTWLTWSTQTRTSHCSMNSWAASKRAADDDRTSSVFTLQRSRSTPH